jgi:hypothetical protein
MTIRRSVAAALVASLLVGAVPSRALADDQNDSRPAPTTLRAAVERAAARLEPTISTAAPADHRPVSRAMQAAYGGGGGGGKTMLIVTLVSTVVGLGATYYMIKEMQKQTNEGQGK